MPLRSAKGQALIIVVLMMVVLLGATGLALDLGRAYGIKAKLNAAVDAASIAAGRVTSQGTVYAKQAADNFFKVNFPNGLSGATLSSPAVDVVRGTNGAWDVTVSASAQIPTFFGGIVGRKVIDVTSTSKTTRSALDMVLVLDTSTSLQSVFGTVKSSAVSFVNHFNPADDRLGLVTFSTGAFPVVSVCGTYPNSTQNPSAGLLNCARGFPKTGIVAAISSLKSNGKTASEEGMKKAIDQLNSLQPGAQAGRRVIVFFSDGAPNTFNGIFSTRSGGSFQGNLFSETTAIIRPHTLYDSTKSYDSRGTDLNSSGGLASLPGYDSGGTIPLASYNNIRTFATGTTDSVVKCNVNKAARNMVENAANIARSQGIIVYSLGYGRQLDEPEISNNCSTYSEKGSTIMKRIANTPDSDTYNSSQPTGQYCYAEDEDQLTPCFSKLASSILRITN